MRISYVGVTCDSCGKFTSKVQVWADQTRPVSIINQSIDQFWQSLLAPPPFPGHTSATPVPRG
ncbi:MAG TPA: hypothetical protein VK364_13005, partial [Hymenobacter sp.]|nr:hypothetical protein [Hymenobacter sp.]